MDTVKKNIKELLLEIKPFKVVELAKFMQISPHWLSVYLNSWRALPAKHHDQMARFFGIDVPHLKIILETGK